MCIDILVLFEIINITIAYVRLRLCYMSVEEPAFNYFENLIGTSIYITVRPMLWTERSSFNKVK